MIPILFLAADPTDASRLRLGREAREIQEKLQLARLRDRFVLHQRPSVRPSDISQALLDTDPEIVHFSGHGTTDGAICLENHFGETHAVEPQALGALFEEFATTVNCVILNACYSVPQAEAIATHIPHVIGMIDAIDDEAAIAFSVGFYQAVGAGRSVEEAYRLGCAQMQLQNAPGQAPVLIRDTTRAPTFEFKSYQFPEQVVRSVRKNRTVRGIDPDRQRIGLVAMTVADSRWSVLGLIESVGKVEQSREATSAAGHVVREVVERLPTGEYSPKQIINALFRLADSAIKRVLKRVGDEPVHCGTKIALALRFEDQIHVACVGDCGALLRWTMDDETYFRSVRNTSVYATDADAIARQAPIGHLISEGTEIGSLPALEVEPIGSPLAGSTDFVILTTHRIGGTNDQTDALVKSISRISTARGVAQFL
jgi:hypothetical protein